MATHGVNERALDTKVWRPHISTGGSEDADNGVVPSDGATVSVLLQRNFSRRYSATGLPPPEPICDGGGGLAPAFDDTKEEEEEGEIGDNDNDDDEKAPALLGDLWQGSNASSLRARSQRSLSGASGVGAFQRPLSHRSNASSASETLVEDAPELVDVDMPYESFTGLEYLGEGAMCRVFKGMFEERAVAVKMPLENGPESADNDLVLEMSILRHLRHPNIIQLVGAGIASNGSHFIALELLQENLTERLSKIVASSKMTMNSVITYCRQLARALEYLHDEAIEGYTVMHRDLKPDNVAFDANDTLKLFDFGLAKVIKRKYRTKSVTYKMTGETGSLRFMAPEVCRCEPYNEKADVHSFSIIMWQMLTNRSPYEGLGKDAYLTMVVDRGQRPHLSKDWPEDLKKLLGSCWDVDLDARPSMREVVGVLTDLEKQDLTPVKRRGLFHS